MQTQVTYETGYNQLPLQYLFFLPRVFPQVQSLLFSHQLRVVPLVVEEID